MPAEEAVKGYVQTIEIMPGRPDVIVRINKDSNSIEQFYFLQPGGVVTLDGVAITIPELVQKALNDKTGFNVTLHPRADRYSASTDAEFETVNYDVTKAIKR